MSQYDELQERIDSAIADEYGIATPPAPKKYTLAEVAEMLEAEAECDLLTGGCHQASARFLRTHWEDKP